MSTMGWKTELKARWDTTSRIRARSVACADRRRRPGPSSDAARAANSTNAGTRSESAAALSSPPAASTPMRRPSDSIGANTRAGMPRAVIGRPSRSSPGPDHSSTHGPTVARACSVARRRSESSPSTWRSRPSRNRAPSAVRPISVSKA